MASMVLDARPGFITSKEIGTRLRLPGANVRHILQECIDDYSLPILASRIRGYKFADSDHDWLEAQAPAVRQCLTGLSRAKARLGERRFNALIARLKVREGAELVRECLGGGL